MQKQILYNAKKVLICPLNWGLGHATRCVPIIQAYIDAGSEVSIVADGFPLQFLKKEFPQLKFIEYPSYPIRYSKGKTQMWMIMRLFPTFLKRIYQEHIWLDNLLKRESYDLVISDNRFGLWNKKVKTIYITHQVMVKMPKQIVFMEYFMYRFHRFFIQRYTHCWIPDYLKNGGLSGDLSHKYTLPKNAEFIGPLSRFEKLKEIAPDSTYQNIVILSGVEPQRTIFEKEMISLFSNLGSKTLILRGKPSTESEDETYENVVIKSHMETEKLAALLKGCNSIICRSGYSTIMDLETLQVLDKAHFYPTPGQTEQEYLAEYHSK